MIFAKIVTLDRGSLVGFPIRVRILRNDRHTPMETNGVALSSPSSTVERDLTFPGAETLFRLAPSFSVTAQRRQTSLSARSHGPVSLVKAIAEVKQSLIRP